MSFKHLGFKERLFAFFVILVTASLFYFSFGIVARILTTILATGILYTIWQDGVDIFQIKIRKERLGVERKLQQAKHRLHKYGPQARRRRK